MPLAHTFAAYVELLSTGSFTAAIVEYYHEDIVQFENDDEPTVGRDNLLAAERAAEKRIRSAEIAINDAVVDEARGLAWGEMRIHFVSTEGVEQRLREAFRQRWRDGRIVEQRFYYKGFHTVTADEQQPQ